MLSGKETGFGFNAEWYDAATGMQNLWARQYEPAMNRFSQKDIVRGIMRDPLSLNRYAFVRNDPVGYVDPSGLLDISSSLIFARLSFSSGLRFFLDILKTSISVLLFYTTLEVYTVLGTVSCLYINDLCVLSPHVVRSGVLRSHGFYRNTFSIFRSTVISRCYLSLFPAHRWSSTKKTKTDKSPYTT
jgi:RHS repeat-associated core domain